MNWNTNNLLNQITGRSVAPYVDVAGVANPTTNVTVRMVGGPTNIAARKGEYFHHALTLTNTQAQYPTVEAKSLYGATETMTGEVYVAATPEVFTYDADGNLTGDGRWTYTWDGENRLVEMKRDVASPAGARQRLVLEYDYQGRRIRKQFYTYSGGWVEQRDTICLYEGWNVMAELDANASNARLRTYVWGNDLSGSRQGAGGVGGLLWVNNYQATFDGENLPSGVQFVAYDGNGNVMALVKAADGTLSARYEYGPFGEPVRTSGALAKAQPFRFSSKWTDCESGLVYYGHRYYSPTIGRWPSRDPLGEVGGANLYGFVYNNPVNRFDRLGLDANTPSSTITPWELGWEWLTGNGPRHRDFGPGDYMTEELRRHGHIQDSIEDMKRRVFFNCQSCKTTDPDNYTYSLAGWGGVLKYLHDYSTLGTGGMTGNLVVTYLGSYRLRISPSDIKCSKGTATLILTVNNSSTAGSCTRPPVIGYTEWWQNNIVPFINDWFSNGGMSETTHTFRWTEKTTFDANHCCVD